ncbi:fimbria/pilus chaperone family protein [Paraburkholderia lacunae]|uniref:Fimbrial chaperone protein n=1 Tax=Paraburkholderia lacunae TaxID=2211104 RepID=A0A370N7L4_9BURK|nr:fimbria/pilus chaperone family protein [Paraburkholderia lacunae]RDK01604.1 fimbrial chaperone protein [Paraburkholderia lacunae]
MKNPSIRKLATLLTALIACLLGAGASHAMGVVPETSVIIVNEADGEGSITVKNTDSTPTLLYTTIRHIPEDQADLLVATPPIARVEPGASQLVRFVLDTNEPLKAQRLSRVIFEGIPPKRPSKNEIQTVIQQNLPVIVSPRDLARNDEPWKLLKWSSQDGELILRNDSRYVVRLEQKVQLLPQQQIVVLPKPYVLPGDSIKVALESPVDAQQVRIFPATVYGYSVEHYDAPLGATADGIAEH